MASTTERKLVVRGRPTPAGSGISGSSTAHSASVVSLAKRSPSRRYCARVISVQDMVLSIESSQIDGITSRWNHSLLFGQPLREVSPGTRRVGVIFNPQHFDDEVTFARRAAESLGIELTAYPISAVADLEGALHRSTVSGAESLFIISSRLTGIVGAQIAQH